MLSIKRQALPSSLGVERHRGRTRSQRFIDRRLLATEAVVLLAVARLLVKYVPMRHWRSWMTTAPPTGPKEPSVRWRRQPAVKWVTKVVPKVAAAVPFRAVCLQQAMAAQWMLHRRGVRCRLLFGTQRAPADAPDHAEERSRPFLARLRRQTLDESGGDSRASSNRYHAWLTIGDVCILGGNVDGYRPLPPIDGIPKRRRPRTRK